MRERLFVGALLLTGLLMPITGCTNPSGLDSIQITPATPSVTSGQTVQFVAIGTYGNANHASTQELTTGVTWTSSDPSVATISASGLHTTLPPGTATITAAATGFKGPLVSTTTLTVAASSTGGGTTGASVVSLAIIQSAQTVLSVNQNTQFIAIGSTSSGATEYLTNAVTWSSSSTAVATIGATTGIATAVSAGSTTITALYTNASTGSVVTGVATFTVSGGAAEQVTALSLLPASLSLSSSGQTSQLVLLAVAGSTGLSENLTSSPNVAWTSSTPTVATVSATGLVTGVNAGATTIVAQYTNTDNSVVTANVPVSVTISGNGTSLKSITSLTVIPSSITVNDFKLSGQFLAIGTFSQAPYVRDVTNDPTTTWLSSEPNSFPVNTNTGGGYGASAGIVTAYASGSAQIVAESMSTDKTIQTATATFSCPYVL